MATWDVHRLPMAAERRSDMRRLLMALSLIVAFMVVEVVFGIVSHSLALLSDAGHMLTDAGALTLALVAMRLATRPPAGGLTYGLKRAEILSGLVNGVTLAVLAVVITAEAVLHLVTPPSVDAHDMLGVALAGIAVNLLATLQVARIEHNGLNVRASRQHILTDSLAFIGTAIAAVVILVSGFQRADALASLGVAALMVVAGFRLMREAVLVLLEAAPAGMRPADIAAFMRHQQGVVDVHDFHVWEITSGLPALSAHVLVEPREDCHAVRRNLETLLARHFRIDHTTLQVDHATSRRSRSA